MTRAKWAIAAVAVLFAGGAYAGGADYARTRATAGPNAMPALGAGEYGTAVDNENNALAGIGDGDMGGTGAPCVFREDSYAPIEFNIVLPASAAGSPGTLNMNVWDVDTNTTAGDPEIDRVSVNGILVGTLQGSDNTWGINFFNIPPGVLRGGKNRVRVSPDIDPSGTDWCVGVEWGIIKVTPTTTDIVRAWVAPVRQTRGQYVNFFAEVTGDFDAIGVYDARGVGLVNLTNPDHDKVWSGQWRIPTTTMRGPFNFSMKGFKAGKTVSTWPAINVQ